MPKNFYIASSFQNIDVVRYVRDQLIIKDFHHTYDWTQNSRAANLEELQRIGNAEKQAVQLADFLVVLLPAGKGSHIEFGIALANDIKIYLYSPNEDIYDMDFTSTFYHLDNVHIIVGTYEQLVEKIFMSEL
ncbi:group-specific protein [Metasolibacillus meyeri]|uniref:Group-specific protein n=1 Tax=Metasolibacillus meyeri TaxID=1071052 RepID=A0AAW9NL62_9BACL|nr:group-specific protein [Metasolibacillus meyeri]MEC1177186.1 group-specific protein [Metasolibacillus meyeri]